MNGGKDRKTDMCRLVISRIGKYLKDGGKVYIKKKTGSGDGQVRIFTTEPNVFLNTETSESISDDQASELFNTTRNSSGIFFLEGIKPGELTLSCRGTSSSRWR
jgi:hypothetical protein